MASTTSSDFYRRLDELFLGLEKFLNNYGKSEILQKHLMDMFKSFFYATLINNFFTNLNDINVKELKLPRGKIGQIISDYKDLRKSVRLTLSCREMVVNAESYTIFKHSVQKDFPGFEKIFQEIEKQIDFGEAETYLKEKEEAIRKSGKEGIDSNEFLMTKLLETYVKKKKNLPIGKNLEKLTKAGVKIIISEFSKILKEGLDKESSEMLAFQRKMTLKYVSQLYKTWKTPIDLLECLIRVSLESGQKQQNKLRNMPDFKDNFKYEALVRIHSRALQISNEILVLLKSGYPDGANSRWRSLHELAVISFFLYENGYEVSKRYLDHEIVRVFKEATDYQAGCRELGYEPLPRKEVNRIRKEKKRLCAKYNDNFQDECGWIPSSLLPTRHFRALEENVQLNKLRPFYNLSCDAVHGGPKGFYRLGLIAEQQKKVLLTGPSDYGLADPMQNTAISLTQISACLLGLTRDFENIVQMNAMNMYTREIGKEAVHVHENIEKRVHPAH